MTPKRAPDREVEKQRWEILHQMEEWLEGPMVVLGFVWLILLVVELVAGITPFLEGVSLTIWILFVFDFLLRFALAPRKTEYLRGNWITAFALVIPAVRVLRAVRFVRVLRAARGVRLVRILTALNRGMRAVGRTMRRRGLGYVVALTLLVALSGAAGMYAFESRPDGEGLASYSEALWWTAMLLTTIGSEYWPQTPEGRILTVLLASYSLGVLGYLTAALASFFLGRDAESEEGELAGDATLKLLRQEILALRAEVQALAGGARTAPDPAAAPDESV